MIKICTFSSELRVRFDEDSEIEISSQSSWIFICFSSKNNIVFMRNSGFNCNLKNFGNLNHSFSFTVLTFIFFIKNHSLTMTVITRSCGSSVHTRPNHNKLFFDSSSFTSSALLRVCSTFAFTLLTCSHSNDCFLS